MLPPRRAQLTQGGGGLVSLLQATRRSLSSNSSTGGCNDGTSGLLYDRVDVKNYRALACAVSLYVGGEIIRRSRDASGVSRF